MPARIDVVTALPAKRSPLAELRLPARHVTNVLRCLLYLQASGYQVAVTELLG